MFPYLGIEELIEFYSVFDGVDGELLKPDLGLCNNIENIYFKGYDSIKKEFIYDDESQELMQKALIRLARGDRKRFSIYKDIARFEGTQVYKTLFQKGVITEERSRENPFWLDGRKKIKKSLRGYRVEDKIAFSSEATRFWFSFIAPFSKEIQKGDFKSPWQNINLEKHISLSFEYLSLELLKLEIGEQNIASSGSFWTKDSEIDLLLITKDGQIMVGECKYKHTKICKSVLNSLQKKAFRLGLKPSKYALFSKSGFSNELLKQKSDELALFDIKDFERLLL